MAGRIVLISDETNFFEYIRPKLELRKSDELFTFSFDSVPEKLSLIDTSVLIINSENCKEKTLDLLRLINGTPAIVFAFNEDEVFRRKCYRAGMLDYMTLLTPDAEFRARLIPALSISSILFKNKQYREFLVKTNVVSKNNEVFIDYNNIIDNELEDINSGKKNAVFAAIAPNEKSKFLLTPNMIETILLNNIRKNDILMNYAPNKYFLLMFDTNMNAAKNLWSKISSKFNEPIYAGLISVSNQKRQQLINEALNQLHREINSGTAQISTQHQTFENYTNFKLFSQEFNRKIEKIITPVFYQIQQKYSNKLSGISLQQETGEGFGNFYIKGPSNIASFRLTCPGFSKINIDITSQRSSGIVDAKRITLEPGELEEGLLTDLLEQFILEYKRSPENENSK